MIKQTVLPNESRADKATQETDGLWLYSAVMSLEQIILLTLNYGFL